MNKKIILLSILLLSITTTLTFTSAYFSTSTKITNKINTISYNFKLNSDGGKYTSSKLVVADNSTNLPTPNKKGYDFVGYSTTKDGNVNFSTKINDISDINDKEIYAKYNKVNYSISYNLNGGSISGHKTSYDVEQSFTLPTPTRSGYSFSGWTGSNGNTKQTSVSIPKGTTGNLSYNANWDTINYSISYNLNGGSISGHKTSYNIEQSFTLPTPTRKGYTFTGWTGSNGNTKQTSVSIKKGTIGNLSYTANWSATNYSISYNLNGGSISGQKTSYNIEQSFTLPTPTRTGYTFAGWTGSNGNTKQTSVSVSKGTTGNLSYTANWNINTYVVDINPVIQNTTYNSGLNGFTFSVWLNGSQVADHVTDYYNGAIPYGTKLRVYVHGRDGYNITSFKDNTWTVTSSFNISPTWYDNIPPTITSFNVTNLGLYNPALGTKAGWNIYIYIDAYDNGTGMQKFQTWLTPYGNGSGSGRKDGQERTMTNVIYLDEPSGRTFCAYAIDNAGNEAERCATIRV